MCGLALLVKWWLGGWWLAGCFRYCVSALSFGWFAASCAGIVLPFTATHFGWDMATQQASDSMAVIGGSGALTAATPLLYHTMDDDDDDDDGDDDFLC